MTSTGQPRATLEGRPGEVIEALAAWEMFRKLGFAAENINVGVLDGSLLVQLHVQGQMPTLRIGRTDMTNDVFQQHWNEIADMINEVPEAELDAVWEHSMSRVLGHEVLAGLVAAGIYWPKHPQFKAQVQ